jgi:predicted transport protein
VTATSNSSAGLIFIFEFKKQIHALPSGKQAVTIKTNEEYIACISADSAFVVLIKDKQNILYLLRKLIIALNKQKSVSLNETK